jgi:DNA-binding GntR family transcriptional regulator
MTHVPIKRTTTVDALAEALRVRILDGDLEPGIPLREQRLSADYGVARHTVRAALRALAAEGVVRVEPHRGARVTMLSAADVEALGELRIALETEAARLALSRNDGRLPRAVHAASQDLDAACRATADGFTAVTDAHEALHHALVRAAGSPRIEAAHAALGGELRLFLAQLQPVYDRDRLAAEHRELIAAIEGPAGPDALRGHVEASTRALLQRVR